MVDVDVVLHLDDLGCSNSLGFLHLKWVLEGLNLCHFKLQMLIEKIILFLLEQQGNLASRIEKLGVQRAILLEQPDIPQISELHEAYRVVGHDLLKLLRFVDLNAIGIQKILKKFDKRFGYRFTDYYLTSRTNHPYSQLQQVFKHVGIGVVVGALSRNLAELQDRQGSYLSIYDQPSATVKDPIIDLNKASVDKLTCSTNFLRFLGQQAYLRHKESEEVIQHTLGLFWELASGFVLLHIGDWYLWMETVVGQSTRIKDGFADK